MAHAGEFSSSTRHYGDRSPEPTNTSTWTVSTHKKSNQPLLPLTSTWRLSEREKTGFLQLCMRRSGLDTIYYTGRFCTSDRHPREDHTANSTSRFATRVKNDINSPRCYDTMSDGENVHQHETSLRTANTQRHWSLICMRCTSFTRDSD